MYATPLRLPPTTTILSDSYVFGDVDETVIKPMSQREKVCPDAYSVALGEAKDATVRASRGSMDALRMSQKLTVAMAAFSTGDAAGKGSDRNKYVTALLCGIRKQQVAAFQKRLDALAADKEDGTRSPCVA